jgi:dTDP-4-dehydrorhamnose 3,5-epimerase
MEITPTPIPGLMILKPRRFGDDRGWFTETWNAETFAKAGIDWTFRQDNHSYSAQTGTLRGLHYQAPPRAQAKLVRCTAGALWDVAVDARPGSPTRGQHFGLDLTPANGLMLLIPAGFLHGFVTTAPDTELIYKCTDTYSPQHDGSVAWDDPTLAIPWPLTGVPVLSAKDQTATHWKDWTNPF